MTLCLTRPKGQILDCDSSTMVVIPGDDTAEKLTELEFKGFLL